MGDSPDDTEGLPWQTDEAEAPGPSAAELEAAGQRALFGDPVPAPEPTIEAPAPAEPAAHERSEAAPEATPSPTQPYRVLARKYRPQTFSELIGQEPMVRTLANAIKRDRLAHAFLMTGVRGVGKTSTARLIAKALNCIGPDGQGGPTIDPCGVCEPCQAIAEGRHIDVIEMDAASNTGVDDVREIIEAVRYAAVSARFKIYIIDEVHMLSRNAFNALLKTLEEPPPHVKFLFATTEVEKLPVTVLSRTQRFDLRRIPAELLQDHFAHVCQQEGVDAEPEALHMIASAAEGSVRDGLSILDQAIAHADLDADGKVTAARVRDMLGLADKGAQRRLFACLLEGDAKGLMAALADQYALGVEPLALMRALMDLTNRITVEQVGGSGADAPTAEERAAIEEWAARLAPGQLHRLWQLLLRGYDEVRGAPDPLVAAQMALLRTLHAGEMPDPGSLVKKLESLAANGVAAATAAAAAATNGSPSAETSAQALAAIDWADLVGRIEARFLHLGTRLRMQVRPITLEPGKLVFAQAEGFAEDLLPELRQALLEISGNRWEVERVEGTAAANARPTLVERDEAAQAAAIAKLREHPLVKATLEAFPDAELLDEDETETRNRSRSA
ncbi:DNA polymerase III subunit gamma/tau [Tsuneonella mangrovi]|uniref:DNA polymerase III subunit gamma/tau n=1 Tax=Tsuneonella mangrovi TaxID=1982042 RepID=UPI000BA2403F|nr:DNA polymerase III subunit gamma/tau [Tsuneonella mangrovi]